MVFVEWVHDMMRVTFPLVTRLRMWVTSTMPPVLICAGILTCRRLLSVDLMNSLMWLRFGRRLNIPRSRLSRRCDKVSGLSTILRIPGPPAPLDSLSGLTVAVRNRLL